MRTESYFTSVPELDKLITADGGLKQRVCSNEVQTLVEEDGKLKPFVDHKMTLLLGVLNGVGVGDLIGEGRFGCVLLGEQMGSLKKLAVKEYHDTFHKDVLTARDDNTLMAKVFFLEHPGLVHTTTVNMSRKICYSVMELGQKNIHDYVMESGKYDEESAKVVVRQLMEAIEFLHDQQIIHGNIHPKNIILFTQGVVKLSDVATGQLLEWIPYSRTPLFVLPYVAPELKEKGMIDTCPFTDMWSLGACIYFIVTGKSPFDGPSRDVIERAIQTGVIRMPISVEDDCRRVLQGMLKVNPSKRMSLKQLQNHEWFEERREVLVSPLLICEEILCKEKEPEADIKSEKAVTEVCDEGYMSNGSEPPNDNGRDERPIHWRRFEGTAEKGEGLLVYVTDNNRDDWDPNEIKIDMCKLITGAVKRPCVRIAIPLKFQEDPEFLSRLQATLSHLAATSDPNCPEVIDSDYGDYSLMDFYGDGVRLCHQPRNGPKFASSKHAARYYNQLNANRLWEYLNLTRCDNCMDVTCHSNVHTDKNCVFQYRALAKPCQEDILWTPEDEHNVRVFTLPKKQIVQPPASRFTRIRKGSMRFFSNGVRRIVKRFRRQSQTTPVSQ